MQTKAVLVYSEAFYSLQGEGRTTGVPALFLRLTGCNLMCGGFGVEKDGIMRDGATWVCDTIPVWMRGKKLSQADIIQKLDTDFRALERLRSGAHLVVTGGEPLLQQERILNFLELLESDYACRPIVEIETNATLTPLPELAKRVQYWNCSPKLSNSGMPKEKRYFPETLRAFTALGTATMYKFVVSRQSDYSEIYEDFLQSGLIAREQIVLMPGADNREDLLRMNALVADICIAEQLRMSTRLHIEIWNKKTGV